MLWQYWLELGIAPCKGDEIKAKHYLNENRKCWDFCVWLQCHNQDYKLDPKIYPVKVEKNTFFGVSWAKHSVSSDTFIYLVCKCLILSFSQRQEAKPWTNQGTFSARKTDSSSWEQNCLVLCGWLVWYFCGLVSNVDFLFSFFFFSPLQANALKVNSVFGRFCSLHSFKAFLKFACCYSEFHPPTLLSCCFVEWHLPV